MFNIMFFKFFPITRVSLIIIHHKNTTKIANVELKAMLHRETETQRSEKTKKKKGGLFLHHFDGISPCLFTNAFSNFITVFFGLLYFAKRNGMKRNEIKNLYFPTWKI